MKKVIIESPYAGDMKKNREYARLCLLDCLKRGEAPFASHLLYTQVMNESDPEMRKLGIETGLEFGKCCDKTVVYYDLGFSEGMLKGILSATQCAREIEFRTILK